MTWLLVPIAIWAAYRAVLICTAIRRDYVSPVTRDRLRLVDGDSPPLPRGRRTRDDRQVGSVGHALSRPWDHR